MARCADGAAHVGTAELQGVSDRPELLEGLDAVDRRLVDTDGSDDVVLAAVAGDGTLLHSRGDGVVGAVGFDNVVLDQGVASPAIDGEVAVSAGQVTSRIAYVASRVRASNSGLR